MSSAAPTITCDVLADAGPVQVGPRNLGVLALVLERDHVPVRPTARANQIVLKPPSVPISRIRRARVADASRYRSLPCCIDTSIAGMPAAAVASRVATSGASSPTSSRSNNASTSVGLGSLTGPTLAEVSTAEGPRRQLDLGPQRQLSRRCPDRYRVTPTRNLPPVADIPSEQTRVRLDGDAPRFAGSQFDALESQ